MARSLADLLKALQVDSSALAPELFDLEVQALQLSHDSLTLRLGFSGQANKAALIQLRDQLQDALGLLRVQLQMRPLSTPVQPTVPAESAEAPRVAVEVPKVPPAVAEHETEKAEAAATVLPEQAAVLVEEDAADPFVAEPYDAEPWPPICPPAEEAAGWADELPPADAWDLEHAELPPVEQVELPVESVTSTELHVNNSEADNLPNDCACASCREAEAFERSQSQARPLLPAEQMARELLRRQRASQPPQAKSAAPAAATAHRGRGNGESRQRKGDALWGRPVKNAEDILLKDLSAEHFVVRFTGTCFSLEQKVTKNGKNLMKFGFTDETNSVTCVLFCDDDDANRLLELLPKAYLSITAEVSFDDRYEHDYQARVRCIEEAQAPPPKQDLAPEKRVELHIHSKMSAKDATSNPKDIVAQAAAYGHPAVALTDHGVVQGFPEAANMQRALKKQGKNIKLIYGVEGYLVDDGRADFYNLEALDEPEDFVSLHLEWDELYRLKAFEALACRLAPEAEQGYSAGERLVWREGEGPERFAALQQLESFVKGKLLLVEKSFENLGRLRFEGYQIPVQEPRLKFNPPLVDWEAFCADCDVVPTETATVEALAARFAELWQGAAAESYEAFNRRLGWRSFADLRAAKVKRNHIIVLVRDEVGLYNLYRLVSAAHLDYFYFKPCMPRSVLKYYRSGLTLGAACVYGEVFWNVLRHYLDHGMDYAKAKEALAESALPGIAAFYDYLEIQPLGNNEFLLHREQEPLRDRTDLQNLNRLVLDLGEISGKPVCATCDSHFLNEKDAIYRRIILADIGMEDAEQPAPLYFRTTEEMLDEFSYLDPETARRVVIDNTQAVAELVQPDLLPFPDGSFPPLIASADEDVERLTYEAAQARYGRNGVLPPLIAERVKKELHSIISNGYAVMYYIAHKLVKKSNDDGYVVGSRGSVGSSLVASFCGITEVNPLPPHYICPHCHYFEEDSSGNYGSGFDLPEKLCPECGAELKREGQDIPFETFLGFEGNKQPDIDLNFSGDYQPRAHAFIEEMFGTSHTFRAGTISGLAEKNSMNIVRNFVVGHAEALDNRRVGEAEIQRLSKGLQGVKVTTGQHPGGIVVVPKEREIYDFTPVQRPADKRDVDTVTTHFDFNAMHDTILKLDVLGHDDPTMLKMLSDITGVKIEDIPIPDKRVMSLFRSTTAIDIPEDESTIGSATIGLPEVGTMMAREMINDTQPTRFYDLVQLSGLSHGESVWKGNAQDLIRNGTCTINEVIGCRDSIMTRLIYDGLEARDAFDIMEKVRKGKGLSEAHEAIMREHNVKEWYIDSCKKIKYMFPKAHAAAYTISMLRIAYFKVYYPEAYYSAYFTIRADEFTAEDFLLPKERIRSKRAEQRKNFMSFDKSEQKKFYILELVEEMQARGIDFLPISLDLSEAARFYSPEKGKIRPPFNILNGISTAVGEQIVQARSEGGSFPNCEELKRRAHIGQSALDSLRAAGVLEGMPESAQQSLFDLF